MNSCFKGDDPIMLPPPANAEVMTIPMGPNYDHEVYVQLNSKDSSGQNYFDWDLAFQSGATDFHLFVNVDFHYLYHFDFDFEFD